MESMVSASEEYWADRVLRVEERARVVCTLVARVEMVDRMVLVVVVKEASVVFNVCALADRLFMSECKPTLSVP